MNLGSLSVLRASAFCCDIGKIWKKEKNVRMNGFSFRPKESERAAKVLTLTFGIIRKSLAWKAIRLERNNHQLQKSTLVTYFIDIRIGARNWTTFLWQSHSAVIIRQFATSGVSAKVWIVTFAALQMQTSIVTLARRHCIRNRHDPFWIVGAFGHIGGTGHVDR